MKNLSKGHKKAFLDVLQSNKLLMLTFESHSNVSQTQVKQGAIAPPNMRIAATRVHDFTKINPLEFQGLRADEDL